MFTKEKLIPYVYKKVLKTTNTKLRRQGGNLKKNGGRDGIIQIAKTLLSLWSLVKKMNTKTTAQVGEVVTSYSYLENYLKFSTGSVK